MSPAKLLGLPQTADSIIIRTHEGRWLDMRPQVAVERRFDSAGAGRDDARKVLRNLIALRRRDGEE